MSNHPMPPPDILIGATICLMSHYAQAPSPKLAEEVSSHLEMLSRHPDCASEELVRASSRLSEHWLRLARHAERKNQSAPVRYFPYQGVIQ
jgi:hypothetical protein